MWFGKVFIIYLLPVVSNSFSMCYTEIIFWDNGIIYKSLPFFVHVYCCCCCFETFSLCNPEWTGNQYKDQADPDLQCSRGLYFISPELFRCCLYICLFYVHGKILVYSEWMWQKKYLTGKLIEGNSRTETCFTILTIFLCLILLLKIVSFIERSAWLYTARLTDPQRETENTFWDLKFRCLLVQTDRINFHSPSSQQQLGIWLWKDKTFLIVNLYMWISLKSLVLGT